MRAGLRFGIAAFAAAFALCAGPALAQNTAAPGANTAADSPPPGTIGPRELENFSLNGTVTRPAPTVPARPAPAPATAAPRTSPATQPGPAAAQDRAAAQPARDRSPSAQTVTVPLPPADSTDMTVTPAPAPGFAVEPGFEPVPAPASLADDEGSNFVPWLLALLLLGAGAGYFFWRQRAPTYATAGGSADAFSRAQPAPGPQPLQRAAPPRPAPPSAPAGVVSTRLRPWLEIEFSPGRCVVEDDKATIQFDVSVYNSGSAPARDVLIEASMFNAGPAQDQEIGAFFEHPVAKGDRIPAIPPLKRVALKSAVSLNRDQMRQFEVAGRRLFVPLVGFNALYRWSGGDGQTSASYLVGRDTKSDKMAPLRLDLGPRIFRDLGARQHNVGVRK
ncbi:MAG TPA: hypothetical protein VMN38_08110 [Sphingomicrobium sp.]|nr:hypothetical protein [Sphingomicrobium sp.]